MGLKIVSRNEKFGTNATPNLTAVKRHKYIIHYCFRTNMQEVKRELYLKYY